MAHRPPVRDLVPCRTAGARRQELRVHRLAVWARRDIDERVAGDACADTYPDADSDARPDADAGIDTWADADPHAQPIADAERLPDGNAGRNTRADCGADGRSDACPYGSADARRDACPDPDTAAADGDPVGPSAEGEPAGREAVLGLGRTELRRAGARGLGPGIER
jgi:hypothetical protein